MSGVADTGGPLICGVDIGTGSVRAIVHTTDGRPVAAAAEPTPTLRHGPETADYDPEALWETTCAVLRQVTAAVDGAERIAGIACTSVGESQVPIDRDGRPVHPAIAWYDRRTRPQAERAAARIDLDRTFAVAGQAMDPIFSAFKRAWIAEHAPEAHRAAVLWLNVADWIAYRLSGVAATDASLAGRTMLLDIHSLDWSEELAEALEVDLSTCAPIRPSGTPLGPVTRAAAEATGLSPSCIVGVGGHDHVCGALAVGAFAPGVMLDSMGTAEAVLIGLDEPITDPAYGAEGYAQGVLIADRPRRYVVAAQWCSGGSVEWFRGLAGHDVPHADLIAEAEAVPAGSHGVLFVPHLRAGTAPHADTRARGTYLGLHADHGRGVLFRALLEGLALDVRLMVDHLAAKAVAPPVRSVRAVGGDTRNGLLVQIKADVFGRPLEVIEEAEVVCLGAAVLGGRAAGVFDDIDSGVAGLALSSRELAPDPDRRATYERIFRDVYEGVFAAVHPLHRRLAGAASPGSDVGGT
ncbi:MAG: FGGY family carbohydrate kinase [Azospirillaceae bacterium]